MTRKTNYDILDKILQEANIPERQGGVWVPDPDNPEQGRWVTTPESLEELRKSVDRIEKSLRS